VNLIELSCTQYQKRRASWWRQKLDEVNFGNLEESAFRLLILNLPVLSGLPQNFEKIETIRELSKKSACDNNNEFR
jgi:hypothetical protein